MHQNSSKQSGTPNDSQPLKLVDDKKNELVLGEWYTCRQSISELFYDTFDSMSAYSSSSSSKKSSSHEKSSDRPKRRPCIVWETIPNIKILVTSKFDQKDIHDPNVQLSTHLSNDYILKRLVPIHPKQPFDTKRSIVTKSAASSSPTIIDTYLVLILITVTNDDKKFKRTFQYIDHDDLIYVNNLMRQIEIDQYDERAANIQRINFLSILNDEDMDSSSSSLLIAREFPVTKDFLSCDQRISEWISTNYNNPSSVNSSPSFTSSLCSNSMIHRMTNDDDNGDGESMIFLINETGEQLIIFHGHNLEVDEKKISKQSCLITHEWTSLFIDDNRQTRENSSNVEDRSFQEEKRIKFQIRDMIKTVDLENKCKRVFSSETSSENDSSFQIMCDIQSRNNHVHIIFSSIGKIVNFTKLSLFIWKENADNPIHYEMVDKVDVDDEYYVPINILDGSFDSSILFSFDRDVAMNNCLSFKWHEHFPIEKNVQLTDGKEERLIIQKESYPSFNENNEIEHVCFSISVQFVQ